MKPTTIRRATVIASFSSALLLSPVFVSADIDTASMALKACVSNNIAAERAKDNPNAENILSTCSVELEAVLAELPAAMRHDARHQIKKDIQTQL